MRPWRTADADHGLILGRRALALAAFEPMRGLRGLGSSTVTYDMNAMATLQDPKLAPTHRNCRIVDVPVDDGTVDGGGLMQRVLVCTNEKFYEKKSTWLVAGALGLVLLIARK